MKWKAFEPGGLSALLSKIVQIGQTADGNTSAVSDLAGDFVTLTKLTEKELGGKRDKGKAVACVLPASGWEQDETESYPYYYDLTAEGISANDRVSIALSPAGIGIAVSCGLCPSCDTLKNKIRVRSTSIPENAIAAEYWIDQGQKEE